MNFASLADCCAHFVGAIQLDDSSISLIALLAGMVGGYRLTGWHEQLKARRARIERKSQATPRRRDQGRAE